MQNNRHQCLLTQCDPARNRARFYALSVEPSLFGDAALVRQWGRIGTQGQMKIELFETSSAAETALARLADRKRRRGYRG